MFGPIAAAYPQHARAMLSLDMTNFAPLVLFRMGMPQSRGTNRLTKPAIFNIKPSKSDPDEFNTTKR